MTRNKIEVDRLSQDLQDLTHYKKIQATIDPIMSNSNNDMELCTYGNVKALNQSYYKLFMKNFRHDFEQKNFKICFFRLESFSFQYF